MWITRAGPGWWTSAPKNPSTTARTSKMNMILHGDGHGGVHHHNGFVNVNGVFEERFDVVLTNPPSAQPDANELYPNPNMPGRMKPEDTVWNSIGVSWPPRRHLSRRIVMDEKRLPAPLPAGGQMLIYRDGAANLQVRLDGQTVWLTQAAMAELFQTTPQNITLHLQSIYDDGELSEAATCKEYLQVRREGSRQVQRSLRHYNLDAILAVGYRVRSARGTPFRQWATARLSELLVKGFTLDDERIKAGRTLGDDYFDELLARIRDIRASERLFYQKITDIYATSIDYDPDAEMTRQFFQIVQNKMHWAAHGHTAAEIVRQRADATKPHMGLTTWKNAPAGPVRKTDVTIAKNYLTQPEIEALNLIVSAYLDFAELQARAIDRCTWPIGLPSWTISCD